MSENESRKCRRGGNRDHARPSTCNGLEGRPTSLTIPIKPPFLLLSQARRPPLHRLGDAPPHPHGTSSGEAHMHAHLSQLQFLLEMFSDVYF